MDGPNHQFGLRSIFGLTAVVAIVMFVVTNPNAAECIPLGICGAVGGAILARLTGTDYIDAAFGAGYGFLAGALLALSLP